MTPFARNPRIQGADRNNFFFYFGGRGCGQKGRRPLKSEDGAEAGAVAVDALDFVLREGPRPYGNREDVALEEVLAADGLAEEMARAGQGGWLESVLDVVLQDPVLVDPHRRRGTSRRDHHVGQLAHRNEVRDLHGK